MRPFFPNFVDNSTLGTALLAAVAFFFLRRLRARNHELEGFQSRQRRILATLESENKTLRKEKELVAARALSQLPTIAQLYGYAQALETNDPGELSEILVDMACSQLDEDNGYVFVLEDGDLVRKAHRDSLSPNLPERIHANEIEGHPLISRAIRDKRLIRPGVDEEPAFREVAAPPGMVMPLLTPWNQVAGILAIRRLRFANCHASAFEMFESIGRWGGMCLARAMRSSAFREATYRDDVTGLFSFSYFSRRIQSEFQLARVHNHALHVVEFRLSDLRTIPSLERFALVRLTADAVEKSSRAVDTIAIGDEPGCFYTIMTLAAQEEVEEYVRRVDDQFVRFRRHFPSGEQVQLRVVRRALARGHESVDDLLRGAA